MLQHKGFFRYAWPRTSFKCALLQNRRVSVSMYMAGISLGAIVCWSSVNVNLHFLYTTETLIIKNRRHQQEVCVPPRKNKVQDRKSPIRGDCPLRKNKVQGSNFLPFLPFPSVLVLPTWRLHVSHERDIWKGCPLAKAPDFTGVF